MDPWSTGIICLTVIILVWLSYVYKRPLSLKVWPFALVSPMKSDDALHPPRAQWRELRHREGRPSRR